MSGGRHTEGFCPKKITSFSTLTVLCKNDPEYKYLPLNSKKKPGLKCLDKRNFPNKQAVYHMRERSRISNELLFYQEFGIHIFISG